MPPKPEVMRCRTIRFCSAASRSGLWRDCKRSPDGAKRNPGAVSPMGRLIPDWAPLHPSYVATALTTTTRIILNAAPARLVLCARQHRPDRRVARSGENPGPAIVDAAQERVSRKTLSDQSQLRRYRRPEMLPVDR